MKEKQFRQVRQQLDSCLYMWTAKKIILDNLDKLDTEQKYYLLWLFEKKYWKTELFCLLRRKHNFVKESRGVVDKLDNIDKKVSNLSN